jgi:hypothetical protein
MMKIRKISEIMRVPDRTLVLNNIMLYSIVEMLTKESVSKLSTAKAALRDNYIFTSTPHILLL